MSQFEKDIPADVRRNFLEFYAAKPIELIQGGFSRSSVIRCSAGEGTARQFSDSDSASPQEYCLRRWPVEFGFEKLEQMRLAVKATHSADLLWLPRYFPTSNGTTFVRSDNGHWEFTEWMPGRADYEQKRSPVRLQAALQALAALHRCWQSAWKMQKQPSPAVLTRMQLLQQARSDSLVLRLRERVRTVGDSRIASLTQETADALQVHLPLAIKLLESCFEPVQTHFVLRDIWSEHVLFSGDRVTGIVDLGAARIDEPATDVARLLGSLEPFDAEAWSAGLQYYCEKNSSVCPERVIALDRVSCLLSALQWAKWLAFERKFFDADDQVILTRWSRFLDRLQRNPWEAIRP
ncbi:MAG: phosphotransferase [Planctomycetota bacterium]